MKTRLMAARTDWRIHCSWLGLRSSLSEATFPLTPYVILAEKRKVRFQGSHRNSQNQPLEEDGNAGSRRLERHLREAFQVETRATMKKRPLATSSQDHRTDERGAWTYLRWTWVAVGLMPVAFVVAMVAGEGLIDALGYPSS